MKRDKIRSKIMLIMIIVCALTIFMLILSYFLLINEEKDDSDNVDTNTLNFSEVEETKSTSKSKTVTDILEKYDCYVGKENDEDRSYVVKFAHDLYDEEGSNKTYFYSIIDEIIELIPGEKFTIYDSIKDIKISVNYVKNGEYVEKSIKINGIENFYENTDANSYTDVIDYEKRSSSILSTDNNMLIFLYYKLYDEAGFGNYYYNKENVDDNLTIYYSENGSYKVATYKSGLVKYIIFSSDYEKSVTGDIKSTTPLSTILNEYSDTAFGSLQEGYLGYYTENYYYFFYGNQAVVYPNYNTKDEFEDFEKVLKEYLNNKNLETFYNELKLKCKYYEDDYIFDSEHGRLKISMPLRGIDIDIYDNDPKGIKIYLSNYYISDDIETLIINGTISYNDSTDLINNYEKERYNSNK